MEEDYFFSTFRSCDKRERRIMKKFKPKKKKVKKKLKPECSIENSVWTNEAYNNILNRYLEKKLPKNWGKVNEGKFFDLIEGNLTTNKEKI